MATLRPGRMPRRRASTRGGFMFITRNGKTYAQAWPRKRGLPKSAYQRAALERMRLIQVYVKHVPAGEIIAMNEGLRAFLSKHTGVRGTAAIRLRDWLTSLAYGRAWAIVRPDGRISWPIVVLKDMSDVLDWIEPRVGSMMVRTADGWMPTSQPSPGQIFTMTANGPNWPDAPAPSVPDFDGAVGGVY